MSIPLPASDDSHPLAVTFGTASQEALARPGFATG